MWTTHPRRLELTILLINNSKILTPSNYVWSGLYHWNLKEKTGKKKKILDCVCSTPFCCLPCSSLLYSMRPLSGFDYPFLRSLIKFHLFQDTFPTIYRHHRAIDLPSYFNKSFCSHHYINIFICMYYEDLKFKKSILFISAFPTTISTKLSALKALYTL